MYNYVHMYFLKYEPLLY